jgi:NAD(P)-dependent dehydrogenase (short-subunit alcohol dehydrogenase family)
MIRRLLITGASSGIGAALVPEAVRRGWSVLATGRNAERLEEQRRAHPEAVRVVATDLTDAGAADELAGTLEGEPLHALVHAAGIIHLGPLSALDADLVDRQWRVNVLAPLMLTQRLMPALRSARGQVVFINSGAGRRANANWGAYAASKFALRAMADAWRAEESVHGVRFTTVYPGRTDTPMQRSVFSAEGRDYDASGLVPVAAVAASIAHVLETAPPALITDLDIRPA